MLLLLLLLLLLILLIVVQHYYTLLACFVYQADCFLAIILCQLAFFKCTALNTFYRVLIGAHGISAAHKAQGIEHSILFFCKGKVHCRVEKADDSTPYDVACMKYGAPVTTPSVPVSAASNPCRCDGRKPSIRSFVIYV